MKNIQDRWLSKTPKFWKSIQKYSILIGVMASAGVAAPIDIDPLLMTILKHTIEVCAVIATMSQLTVDAHVRN